MIKQRREEIKKAREEESSATPENSEATLQSEPVEPEFVKPPEKSFLEVKLEELGVKIGELEQQREAVAPSSYVYSFFYGLSLFT